MPSNLPLSTMVKVQALQDAHVLVRKSFEAQLDAWWVYIWPFGIRRIRARDKLLRIGQHLVDQIKELRSQ